MSAHAVSAAGSAAGLSLTHTLHGQPATASGAPAGAALAGPDGHDGMAGRSPRAWPALREDLQLHHGPALPDGQPSWTVHDPVRHRFLRIDWLTHEVLGRWSLADAELIAEQINQQTTLALTPAHVAHVLEWAEREELVMPAAAPAAARGAPDAAPGAAPGKAAGAGRLGQGARWLLHHYLFFRIPLFNPDRLLQRLLPWLAPLGSTLFTRLTIGALLLGLYGASRQWSQLQAQWLDLWSWQGLALYGATLVAVKVAHEFGHALVARHHGLRVPTMGVAFMVLWPVAYTDTSEAWRLADARARAAIAAAGVRTELTLAAWSTLAWVLWPEGALRSAAFVVATMTWISSLAINLSPFMRFDGYFLLSDALDLPNLHARSFALARWWLRRVLLGWQAAAPEHFNPLRRRALIAFAFVTWGYRLVVYLGIAWMVYHFGFPALGMLLLAVEVGWFVALPLAQELRVWRLGWPRWRGARRWLLSGGLLLLAAGAACWPWPVRESAGAVMQARQEMALRLPETAVLRQVHVVEGQRVAAGAPLLVAEAPKLQQQLATATSREHQFTQQAAGASVSADGEQQRQWQALQAGAATAREQAEALQRELERFEPRAAFDGLVVDMDPALRVGQVAPARRTLLRLAQPGPRRVRAYVSEYAAQHLRAGDKAGFSADAAPLQRWRARVLSVAPHAASVLSEALLVRAHGGPIDAREQSGSWLPLQSLYRVELELEEEPDLAQRHWRGHITLDLPGLSPWVRAWHAAGEVLAREVGF